jgi:hypothetical protein
MASFGDFSSLLQLGVGTGIGLSLFRAPVDLRVNSISRTIENELIALEGATTPFAVIKRRDISDLKLRFLTIRDRLNQTMIPFMIAAVMGALINLVALIDATFNADSQLSFAATIWMVFIAVGWFLIELLVLEIIARTRLGELQTDLDLLRQSRTSPMQFP